MGFVALGATYRRWGRSPADMAHEQARERRNVQITDFLNNFAQTHRADLEQALRLVNACLLQPHQGREVRFRLVASEQDHRAIKRVVRPMLGFKSFRCARAIIATMRMIKKGQLDGLKATTSSAADKFYSLAF